MSGDIIPVQKGPGRQISGPLALGTTVKNMDSVNSVWISSDSSVAPNNGYELTPLGTMRWTTDKGQIWACVDTGVTTTVLLNISDDVDQTTDPVATGAAIAAQLIISGVRPIQSAEVLLQQSVPAGPAQFYVDVSQFSSLTVNWLGGPAGTGYFDIDFYDSVAGNPLGTRFVVSCGQSIISQSAVVPVLGPVALITVPSNGFLIVLASTINVPAYGGYGSNPSPQISSFGSQTFVANVALPVGISYGNGRSTWANLTVGAGATNLDVFLKFNNSLNPLGASYRVTDQTQFHATSGILAGYAEFIHPLGSVDWLYRFTAGITTGPQITVVAS